MSIFVASNILSVNHNDTPILLLMDIWIVSSLGSFDTCLLVCMVYICVYAFLLNIHLEVELLGQRSYICSDQKRLPKWFSLLVVSIYIPTKLTPTSGELTVFPHILYVCERECVCVRNTKMPLWFGKERNCLVSWEDWLWFTSS